MNYVVTWEIDIFDATDPIDAAKKAVKIQQDINSIAHVFSVIESKLDGSGETHLVDLDDLETED